MHLAIIIVGIVALSTLAIVQYRAVRSPIVLIPSLVSYYWSLHGGLHFLIESRIGEIDIRYLYVFEVMFPVAVDETYQTTLIYLVAFCIIFQISWMYLSSRRLTNILPQTPVLLDTKRVPVATWFGPVAAVAALISFASLWLSAEAMGVPAYALQRDVLSAGQLSAFQFFSKVAFEASFLGMIAMTSAVPAGRYASPQLAVLQATQKFGFAVNFIAFMTSLAACLVAGTKGLLLPSAITCAILVLLFYKRISLKLLAVAGAISIEVIATLDVFRAFTLEELLSGDFLQYSSFQDLFLSAGRSSEASFSHFSMYGVLANNVQAPPGYSFSYVMEVLIPIFLGFERSEGLYSLYVHQAGLSTEQGFTLHNAAGWYMEFGAVGIPIGGFFLALCISLPLIFALWRGTKSSWFIGCLIAFAGAVGDLPSAIRSPAAEPLKPDLLVNLMIGLSIAYAFGLHARAQVEVEDVPSNATEVTFN